MICTILAALRCDLLHLIRVDTLALHVRDCMTAFALKIRTHDDRYGCNRFLQTIAIDTTRSNTSTMILMLLSVGFDPALNEHMYAVFVVCMFARVHVPGCRLGVGSEIV